MESAEHKPFFPLFVDMSGRKALIAGGGKVAARRIPVLLDFGADITVIAPEAAASIEAAAARGAVRLIKRAYRQGDVAALAPFLVIAATDRREVNRQIAREAGSLNIWVSAADCRADCTCYFPAIADNGACVAGVVSKDGNHAAVKQIAEKIRGALNS